MDPVKAMDAGLLAARGALAAPAAPADAPLELSSAVQLFVDDHLIARKGSVHRRLNRPRKGAKSILVPDRPWEGQGLVYGSVIPHEGQFRLYYKGWMQHTRLNYAEHVRKFGFGKYPVCLALSEDGRRFRKPAIAGAAHPKTNIVIEDQIDDFTILKDARDPDPNRRFKLLASRGNWWAGLTPATSPDGIRWTWGKENAVAYLGDRCSFWFDPVREKYIAWSRNYEIMPGRVLVQKATADFDNWSDERASHPRLVLQPDRYDHEMTQFYGGYAFWYHSLYLAYVEAYHIHHQRIDTQLACSRDGLTWTRLCDRDVFLPNGEHGDSDAYWIVPTFNPPILQNGELLIHYNGRPDPHGAPGFSFVNPGMGGDFGLATLREDGFVSLDATGEEGVVETRPLRLPEQWSRFEINVAPFNTRPGYDPMQIEVDVLSPDGAHWATLKTAPPKSPDAVWHRVLPAQAIPRVCRLRFRIRNARLYAFRFA